MPFRELVIAVNTDDAGNKLMLENWIAKIEINLTYAKASNKVKEKLLNGTLVDRKEWIVEAEAELAKFNAELSKYI